MEPPKSLDGRRHRPGPRRRGQGVPAAGRRRRRPRPVRGLPRHRGGRRRLEHRDVRRGADVDRLRPVARRPVPHADRQDDGREPPEGHAWSCAIPTTGPTARPVRPRAARRSRSRGNVLCFDLAGDGALAISMNIEVPGQRVGAETQWTQIKLHDVDGGDPLPPYVRLIHDILLGDRALFTRPDGLEEVWHAAGAALDGSRRAAPLRARLVGTRRGPAPGRPGRVGAGRPGRLVIDSTSLAPRSVLTSAERTQEAVHVVVRCCAGGTRPGWRRPGGRTGYRRRRAGPRRRAAGSRRSARVTAAGPAPGGPGRPARRRGRGRRRGPARRASPARPPRPRRRPTRARRRGRRAPSARASGRP